MKPTWQICDPVLVLQLRGPTKSNAQILMHSQLKHGLEGISYQRTIRQLRLSDIRKRTAAPSPDRCLSVFSPDKTLTKFHQIMAFVKYRASHKKYGVQFSAQGHPDGGFSAMGWGDLRSARNGAELRPTAGRWQCEYLLPTVSC